MRAFKTIYGIIIMLLCIGSFYVVSIYYDSYHDRFSFVDLNVVEVNEGGTKESSLDKPKISFANVYNHKYKYYQIVGIYFVLGFVFSLVLVGMIMTKNFKLIVADLIGDKDDMIIFFMTSVSLGLILTFMQVVIYNHVFIKSNNINNQPRIAYIDTKFNL